MNNLVFPNMQPFRFWCQMALPTVLDDSLSYYEVLNKVVKNLNVINENMTDLAQSMVEPYDPEKPYVPGDYVWKDGKIYKCVNNNYGTWNLNDWMGDKVFTDFMATDFNNLKSEVRNQLIDYDVLINSMIYSVAKNYDPTHNYQAGDYISYVPEAEYYDEDETYSRGDFCVYGNYIFECDTSSTTGTFDPSAWKIAGVMYKCLEATSGTFDPSKWTSTIIIDEVFSYMTTMWAAFIADYQRTFGIVNSIGDSVTDAMSQKATTNAIKDFTNIPNKFLEVNKSDEATFFDAYSASNTSNVNLNTVPYIAKNNNTNIGIITKIKLNVVTAGQITIGTVPKSENIVGEAFDETTFKERYIIDVETGEHEYPIFAIVFPDEDYAFKSTNAVWKYGSTGVNAGFNYITHPEGVSTVTHSTRYIGVKLDGYNLTSNLVNEVKTNTNTIDIIANLLGVNNLENITYLDSYSSLNDNTINISTKPFIIPNTQLTSVLIDKIIGNFNTGGITSYGVINKELVVSGATFDDNSLVIKGSFTATTGYKEYSVEPFIVKPDEYIFIGIDGESSAWLYGSNGTDKNFFYVPDSTGIFTKSTSGIGLNITGKEFAGVDGIRFLLDSIYANKSFSFLGDSITTFAGYIPSDNTAYYPHGTITSVNDTWWFKLIKALGASLNTNNSWSGSRVSTTGSNPSAAGCGTRCQELGIDPDVIIVFMGINDFNNEVNLGTYNGTTTLPETTTTFREAYAVMLNKILTAYPQSEIYVCTLIPCERNSPDTGFPEINGNGVALSEFNDAIIELANAFGVNVIPLHKSGLTYQNMSVYNPDELHPNKLGHSLMANKCINILDNAIGIRYATT